MDCDAQGNTIMGTNIACGQVSRAIQNLRSYNISRSDRLSIAAFIPARPRTSPFTARLCSLAKTLETGTAPDGLLEQSICFIQKHSQRHQQASIVIEHGSGSSAMFLVLIPRRYRIEIGKTVERSLSSLPLALIHTATTPQNCS